ncbi:MAG: hypothetical protein ABI995_12495 [Acidobacteriota bacterium]
MELDSVGTIVATRELLLHGVSKVTVHLGMPQPFPDDPPGSFYCPFQILGIGDEKVYFAGGADTFQALYLAMKMIGIHLYTSKEWTDGELTLDAGRDLDIPVEDVVRDLFPPKPTSPSPDV